MRFGYHMGGPFFGGGGGHPLWRGILALVILAAVVFLVVWLASRFLHRGTPHHAAHHPGPPETAREILDRRLASGELTVTHYQQLRKALADEPAAPRRRSAPPAAGSA
jgi:uncharacterized membrane protein